jgi:hypothetical protein
MYIKAIEIGPVSRGRALARLGFKERFYWRKYKALKESLYNKYARGPCCNIPNIADEAAKNDAIKMINLCFHLYAWAQKQI